jgi:uncharacterized protein (DUF4415 family)
MSANNMNESSETDWGRVNAMSDEMIDTSDIPALTKSFFERATLRLPRQHVPITLQVDSDVLAWVQSLGAEYERRMNAALRIYAEAHQASGPS